MLAQTVRQRIRLPHDWEPTKHQLPLWTYLERGGLRGVAVWHRRAGKDSAAINWTAIAAHKRVGVYWHMLPEANQGRKVIWDGIDRAGRRIIDQAFPSAIRKSSRSDEMSIHLKCGSIWQVVGSDNYNSLIGANPVGVVFSEYSVAKPAAWDYIRPILAENGGWALFIYTPRGKNHGKRLFDNAKKLDGWFAELLTVRDTHIISEQTVAEERASGMSKELVDQEYYCSWEGAIEGAYYSDELQAAREQGRVTQVPYQKSVPVNTFWDLGANDTTAIWCHQQVAMQHRFLKGYEASGEPLAHYVKWLKEQPYAYGTHFLPHDADHRKLGMVDIKSARQMLQELLPGHSFVTVPVISDVLVGIQQTRDRFSECWFDAEGCEAGLDALGQYHKEWDENMQTWRSHPKHDWASNYADAFRQFGQGWRSPTEFKPFVKPFRAHDAGVGY